MRMKMELPVHDGFHLPPFRFEVIYPLSRVRFEDDFQLLPLETLAQMLLKWPFLFFWGLVAAAILDLIY